MINTIMFNNPPPNPNVRKILIDKDILISENIRKCEHTRTFFGKGSILVYLKTNEILRYDWMTYEEFQSIFGKKK